MASRKPVDTQRPKVILPDLPRRLFPDAEPEQPANGEAQQERRSMRHTASTHAPRARIEPVAPRQQKVSAPPNVAPARGRVRVQPEMIVLPTPRQIAGQTVPSLLAAVSLWLAARGATLLSPLGLPFWLIILLAPTLLLLLITNRVLHPFWRNAALANLATISIVLPILALRRYAIAVPSFLDGHGVLLAPVVATIAAAVAIITLAIGIAFATREDPEYAGLLLLPACLLVPMCVGMSINLTLSTWLTASAAVFVAVGLATLTASLLPGALAALVAPGAIALQFLFLTVIRRNPVFPHAGGPAALILFWSLLVIVVVLAVLLPLLSQWLGRVDRRARSLEYART